MKTLTTFLVLSLLDGCICRAERVVIAGFDLSGSAWHRGQNPYDDGWAQILKTV